MAAAQEEEDASKELLSKKGGRLRRVKERN